MDLVNPAIKMSKSAENKKGVIYLLDDLDVIRKKIMGATTDSEMVVKYDVSNKPGISNLINIYASLTGKNIEEVEEEFSGKNYGEFKRCVSDKVVDLISHIQDEYNKYINSDIIDEILDDGARKTIAYAKEKYELVQKNIAGEISDLEFLLAQEELAQAYQEEMAAKQQETNNQTAREWLLDYENRNLYQ